MLVLPGPDHRARPLSAVFRVSDQTPEQRSREAGEAIANAIADNLEAVLLKMADSIARVQAEQAEQRDTLTALATRVDGQAQWIIATRDKLEASGISGPEL